MCKKSTTVSSEPNISTFITDESLINASTAEKWNALRHHDGDLPFSFKNDYIFHVVFQENNDALKELVACVLDISVTEIRSLVVTNPIFKGKTITDKDFILDIETIMNNNERINLEMQVKNYHDWPERSLSYLCRKFDSLKEGEPYHNAKPCIHIGFLDFSLYEEKEKQKFHYKFLLRDEADHHIYTSKFLIHVLDLTQIDNIDSDKKEDEKERMLRKWAKLFQATTWKEVKQLAEQSSSIMNTLYTYHCVTADETVREKARARERYERDEISRICYYQDCEKQIQKGRQQLQEGQQLLHEGQQLLHEGQQQLREGQQQLQEERHELATEQLRLERDKKTLHQTVQEMDHKLQESNSKLQESDYKLQQVLQLLEQGSTQEQVLDFIHRMNDE